jgi:hypothetical protein
MKNGNFELVLIMVKASPIRLVSNLTPLALILKVRYSIAYNPAYKADVLTLKSAQLGTDLLLLKISNNIYQILESNSKLMNGNGGWSIR